MLSRLQRSEGREVQPSRYYEDALALAGAVEEHHEEELFGPAEGLHATYRNLRELSSPRPAPIDSPVSNSAIPRRIVSIAIPVARAVAAIPPRPAARASDAAHNRRCRSFNSPASERNFAPIATSSTTHQCSTQQPNNLLTYL